MLSKKAKKQLVELADSLDKREFLKEADIVDSIIKIAEDEDEGEENEKEDEGKEDEGEEDEGEEEGNEKKGFVTNIEEDTLGNDNFRKVLYTGENSQLVLMSLKEGEDIGEEVHTVDQFFRIDQGEGKTIINGEEHSISDGFSISIPAGAKHNIINTGTEDLKLYSLYSPPQHEDGTVHTTKEEAMADEEKFDGETTE